MRTVPVHRALACGIDCLDTMDIETRMDIGSEIVYANSGVLAHTGDENRVMINLFEIGQYCALFLCSFRYECYLFIIKE